MQITAPTYDIYATVKNFFRRGTRAPYYGPRCKTVPIRRASPARISSSVLPNSAVTLSSNGSLGTGTERLLGGFEMRSALSENRSGGHHAQL